MQADRPPGILIVEDEAVVALDLQIGLQDLGYEVAGIADTAAEALALARRQRPQLALMDILLKGDVDGIQAAADLRREFDIPVIFLTSYSDSDTVRRAARTAPYGYLTKPYQMKELRAGIEIALCKSRMERQLRETDRWFALTLRCVQDGVVAMDADARVRFVNAAAEAMIGWSSDEAAGRPVAEVVHFEENGLAALVESALREGAVVGVSTARLVNRQQGRSIAVDRSAGPIDDNRGRRLGAVLVLRDAEERLRQEERLSASEQRFRTAFDRAPLGMALVSLDGRFLQVNDALCSLLGRDRASLLQQPQRSLTHPDDSAHESARLAALASGGETLTLFEKRFLAGPDARPLPVLVTASMVGTDEAMCHLYQVLDLSEQRAAAEQLAELAGERLKREASEQAARTQREFLAHLSHEMRTPLNAVLGFAQLLQMRSPQADRAAEYSEHILAAGKHLLALVDDVLDLQRAADGSLRLVAGPVALDELLPATVALLQPIAQPREVRVECEAAAGLTAKADLTRLRQVLLNLGSNAIKYNVHGGWVRFAAHPASPGRVRLTVEDSGIGMSSDQLAHLFEPFNRLGREALRIPGVGLGLAISRKLVEQMGGLMSVQSHPTSGTVVAIELPAPAPADEPMQQERP